MYYIRTADHLQRTAPWLEELDGGLDHLREVIIDDSLGLAADFEAAMQRHVVDTSANGKRSSTTPTSWPGSCHSSMRPARPTQPSNSPKRTGARSRS